MASVIKRPPLMRDQKKNKHLGENIRKETKPSKKGLIIIIRREAANDSHHSGQLSGGCMSTPSTDGETRVTGCVGGSSAQNPPPTASEDTKEQDLERRSSVYGMQSYANSNT
ncbi:unnamed protein product [Pieris macdunnoughi]|uniref:Uncharacterized protein n=1 Tax=Pieris macdunnoughi TaxID=345717 RepID=A0A821WSN7_9NEOP|nr:unnamed protein product [Pieris macdunnoughi]